MKDYVNKLFKEYKKTVITDDNFDNFYDCMSDDFTTWLLEKNYLNYHYTNYLLSILEKENICPKLILELYKGYADSIALCIRDKTNYKSYVVTKYHDTINKYYKKSSYIAFDGKLTYVNDEPFIWYPDINNCFLCPNFNPVIDEMKIDMIISQLPLNDQELDSIIKLANEPIDIFLGIYGNNKDINKEYNIEKTNEIYNKINDISNIKPKRYYDFSDNVYTSIIKYGNK